MMSRKNKNLTPYGEKRFRPGNYMGSRGLPQDAVILDIDGTILDWGSAANPKVIEFARRHHEKNHMIIVITARTQEWEYESSFNLLMNILPFPFVGPICRSDTDPRYASEFKREIAQGFEDMGLYRIVGAADDSQEVIRMWRWWAKTHFTDSKDFDLLESAYTSYADWRTTLPRKGPSVPFSVTKTASDWSHYSTKPSLVQESYWPLPLDDKEENYNDLNSLSKWGIVEK